MGPGVRTAEPQDRQHQLAHTPGELLIGVHQGPTELFVSASGDLDLYTVPGLRAALAGRDRERQDLTVDLSGVTFLDTAGLHLLIEFRGQACRNGTAFRIVTNRLVLRALGAAGIAALFEYALRPPTLVEVRSTPAFG